jgi:4-hydroxybenzoate polyprenyltransferase
LGWWIPPCALPQLCCMNYQINKGINKPIEFKGLKAQYIGYLGGGLVALLVLFAVLYLIGLAIYLCILIIAGSGSLLFYKVFELSHRYGQHGLRKRNAKRYLPTYLKFQSRTTFYEKR